MTERGRVGESHILQVFLLFACRNCEKRSDEAIHTFFGSSHGLFRCARDDGKTPVCVSVCDGDAVAA
jgi:hypothetical protein